MAGRKVKKHGEREIRAAHARYMRLEEPAKVAADLGVSRPTMLNRFRKYGLRVLPRWRYQKLVSEEAVRAAHARYIARETRMVDLARELGISTFGLVKAFARRGLPRHPTGPWPGSVRPQTIAPHECVLHEGTCLVCEKSA